MNGDFSLTPRSTAASKKDQISEAGFLSRKMRYKFWILAAILLLALWSMLTGSVSLKWSAGALTRFYDGPILDDLDVLEVEEGEREAREMWKRYRQGGGRRMRRFWEEAFEAAYEELVSEVAGERDAALLEIAKMSLQSTYRRHKLPTLHSQSGRNVENSKHTQAVE